MALIGIGDGQDPVEVPDETVQHLAQQFGGIPNAAAVIRGAFDRDYLNRMPLAVQQGVLPPEVLQAARHIGSMNVPPPQMADTSGLQALLQQAPAQAPPPVAPVPAPMPTGNPAAAGAMMPSVRAGSGPALPTGRGLTAMPVMQFLGSLGLGR